jgi:hypothetical protein
MSAFLGLGKSLEECAGKKVSSVLPTVQQESENSYLEESHG